MSENKKYDIFKVGLSTRASNCLSRRGINYLSELTGFTRESIYYYTRGLGKISFREIEEKMGAYGLSFKGEARSGKT